MSIPLSMLGINKEERDMLANRLFPEANKIFLRNLAVKQGYDPEHIEHLDYSDHPVWKMEKMMRDRQTKADYLKKRIEDGTFDISKHEYKYKTIEEAQELDKESKHIQLNEGQSVEKLNAEIEDIKLKNIQKTYNDIEDEKEDGDDICGND